MMERDDFVTADLSWAFRGGANDSDSESLLKTAASIVENESAACGDWQLLQRRQEIDDPRVQRALDVLVAGNFSRHPQTRTMSAAASQDS
jgi:hypothetical protein